MPLLQQIPSENIFIILIPSVSCAQLNVGYSIVASIVPCLKNFMSAFEKPITNINSYHMRSNVGGKKKSCTKCNTPPNTGRTQASEMSWTCIGEGDDTRPDSPTFPDSVAIAQKLKLGRTTYEAIVTGRPKLPLRSGNGMVSADDESDRRMIIQRGIEWSVDFDSASRMTRSPSPPDSSHHSTNRLEEHRVLW